MPALLPIFKKAYWSLVALGSIYAAVLLLLTNPVLQRHALYAHKLHTGYWDDLQNPESSGFGKNQVTPFYLSTPDGEKLYGWHILPLALYGANEDQLSQQKPWPPGNFSGSLACKLLLEDPESRVVINFHGNAGHVAQGQRPATYRSLTSASPKIHVLTLDYRGFGLSTGTPSERGLEIDGVALVKFVLGLGIPPSRIIILGQSLGTAVSTAVALHFADSLAAEELLPKESTYEGFSTQELAALENAAEKPIDFAGIILVASFSSLPKLLLDYRISGMIPLLRPLRGYPRLQNMLISQLRDTWNTSARISALTSSVAQDRKRNLTLHIIHARNDWDIPYRSGEENFQNAEEQLPPQPPTPERGSGFEEEKRMWAHMEARGGDVTGRISDGDGNVKKEVWLGEEKRIRLIWESLRYGGHNQIVADVPVALAVLRGFGLVDERIGFSLPGRRKTI